MEFSTCMEMFELREERFHLSIGKDHQRDGARTQHQFQTADRLFVKTAFKGFIITLYHRDVIRFYYRLTAIKTQVNITKIVIA